MSNKSKKTKKTSHQQESSSSSAALSALLFRLQEGALLLLFALSVFLLVALMTYHHSDPGWTHAVKSSVVLNAGGRLGAWFSDVFLYALGYVAYLLPVTFGYTVFLYYWHRHREGASESFRSLLIVIRAVGFILLLLSFAALFSLFIHPGEGHLPSLSAGGALGQAVAAVLIHSLNKAGSTLLLVTLVLIGVTLLTGVSWLKLVETIGAYTIQAFYWAKHYCCYPDLTWLAEKRVALLSAARPFLLQCRSRLPWSKKDAGEDPSVRQEPLMASTSTTELSMVQAAVGVTVVKKKKIH